ALFAAGNQLSDERSGERSVGLECGRLMQPAEAGTGKERHPLELAQAELWARRKGISGGGKGQRNGNPRGYHPRQLLLQCRRQLLRSNVAVSCENTEVAAQGEPAVQVDAEFAVEATLCQVQSR